jgi:hypothetical protein
MQPQMTIKGYNGTLEVFDNKLVIKRGIMYHKGRGEKEIYLRNVSGIQLKKPGLSSGYFQISHSGAKEHKGGAWSAVYDENTIVIGSGGVYKEFEGAKRMIEQKIDALHTPAPQTASAPPPTSNPYDELERLAKLKEQGIITEDEFNAKKRQLLGL